MVYLTQFLGNTEYIALIHEFKTKKIIPEDSSDYDQLLSDFVGDSCIPGTYDEKSFTGDREKMCRCPSTVEVSSA